MAAHAYLSASGAHRWMVCPGSAALEATLPRGPDSPYAAEGTAAHTLADQCLRQAKPASAFLGQQIGDFTVDTEMVDAVQLYIDYINAVPGKKHYEQRVDFSAWVPKGFGTSDTIVLHDGVLTVVDLKYGKGVKVDAAGNPQAMLYALGALAAFDFLYEFDRFRLSIVQPRIDHISEWEIGRDDLLAWAEGTVKPAAKLALSKKAPFRPDEKACRFCGAKSVCRALAAHALEVATEGMETVVTCKDVKTLDNNEIAYLLSQADLIADWVRSLEAYAQAELEAGHDVPGYKLVAGRALRQWCSEAEAVTALDPLIPADQLFTRKIISPAQAEKILGKNNAVLTSIVIRPEGKPTIAPVSDKRPAVVIDPLAGFEAA